MHYYLMIFPTEALIASMLDSKDFGSYMATGAENTAAEQLIFAEITGEFGTDFDWDFAKKACVAHPDGRPKNSVYLSVYRVLERVPLHHIGDLYLVTRDGLSLKLVKNDLSPPVNWKGYALYKELCPVTPLVATALLPEPFSLYLLDSTVHISMPAIVFADIKIDDLDRDDKSEGIFSQEGRDHLRLCFDEVRKYPRKKTKTIDRSFSDQFSYTHIGQGIYFARAKEKIIFYPMLDVETIRKNHYEWGRSANFYSDSKEMPDD